MSNKVSFFDYSPTVRFKIFLYKMKKLYSELSTHIFYSPDKTLSTGFYGSSQLFTINGDVYLYSSVPSNHQFRKVIGIYKKNGSIFMILLREDGFYEIQKDNFTFFKLFKDFNECKKYIEVF